VSQSPIFDAAQDLLHLMIARSTDTPEIDGRAYKVARDAVMADPTAAKLAPECVRICRSPDEVWTYVKGQFGLDTYHERRVFFRAEYESMLAALERFESAPLDDLVSAEAAALNSASVVTAWNKALERRTADPDGAITAARTLLESVCKTILDDLGETHASSDDLPKLYRSVSRALKLAPTDHTEEHFKRILGGATSVVEGLGSLRNRQGDAHGQGRKTYRASKRHAALAVNLAGSMAAFLMQTWDERQG
jgi:hypothetical protein